MHGEILQAFFVRCMYELYEFMKSSFLEERSPVPPKTKHHRDKESTFTTRALLLHPRAAAAKE